MSDLLIVGQGRSGTTWVGEVLGRAEGARYVHEPDDERRDPQALRARLRHVCAALACAVQAWFSFAASASGKPPSRWPTANDNTKAFTARGRPSSSSFTSGAEKCLKSVRTTASV